jgi:hypothetical protein
MLSNMDISKMLAELRAERTYVDEVIIIIEGLARGHAKRRGRPPAWMTSAAAPKRRGRPRGSKNKPKDEINAEQADGDSHRSP